MVGGGLRFERSGLALFFWRGGGGGSNSAARVGIGTRVKEMKKISRKHSRKKRAHKYMM